MTLLRTIPEARPFSPESLADRWECSAESIRQQCRQGRIKHFRLGRLYRIPAQIVEDIEKCQTSQSDVSGADSASFGVRTESADAISLRHAPERKRKQKP